MAGGFFAVTVTMRQQADHLHVVLLGDYSLLLSGVIRVIGVLQLGVMNWQQPVIY